MIINGNVIDEDSIKEFAYDGCHKIYLIEDSKDKEEALKIGYNLISINLLEETYEDSCSLKFISNWKLSKSYVGQFEEANFEY